MTRAINENSLSNLIPFKGGYDSRRSVGAPKGKNYKSALTKKVYEENEGDIYQVFVKVIQRALWGHDPSQKIVIDLFGDKNFSENSETDSENDPWREKVKLIPRENISRFMDGFTKLLNEAQEKKQVVEPLDEQA